MSESDTHGETHGARDGMGEELGRLRGEVESLKNSRADVTYLRSEVASLKSAVARLAVHVAQTQAGSYGLDAYLGALAHQDADTAFMTGVPPGDYPGLLQDVPPDGSGSPRHTPPRNLDDVLPRHGRNPRIGCEQFDSGTWVHGRPHDCPRSARR